MHLAADLDFSIFVHVSDKKLNSQNHLINPLITSHITYNIITKYILYLITSYNSYLIT